LLARAARRGALRLAQAGFSFSFSVGLDMNASKHSGGYSGDIRR